MCLYMSFLNYPGMVHQSNSVPYNTFSIYGITSYLSSTYISYFSASFAPTYHHCICWVCSFSERSQGNSIRVTWPLSSCPTWSWLWPLTSSCPPFRPPGKPPDNSESSILHYCLLLAHTTQRVVSFSHELNWFWSTVFKNILNQTGCEIFFTSLWGILCFGPRFFKIY